MSRGLRFPDRSVRVLEEETPDHIHFSVWVVVSYDEEAWYLAEREREREWQPAGSWLKDSG